MLPACASMPTMTPRQGTSVPVAIPMAARHMVAATAGPPDADAADGDPRAATFVPPHQLLQRMSGADRFSLGVSAGVRRAKDPAALTAHDFTDTAIKLREAALDVSLDV